MKKSIFTAIIASAICICLAACGAKSEQVQAFRPEATPTPSPKPTPFEEPVMGKGQPVTIDGIEIEAFTKEGALYTDFEDFSKALKSESTDDWTVTYHGLNFVFSPGEDRAWDDGREINLDAPTIKYEQGERLYIPVKSVCTRMGIAEYTDQKDGHIYFTSAAGIWTVPKGYTVPVLMYYGAGVASGKVYSNDIFAREEEFAKQLEYLAGNGYSLIGFEDLWNVAGYEKPVIICFDTGYANNYKTVFPLIKKYNAKISVFLSTGLIGTDGYLSEKQIQEMNASNLVTFQSRGVDGESFAFKISSDQEKEIEESVLRIVRLTGKQPSAFSYPNGEMTETTQQLCLQNFKFGCRLRGERAWNTADKPEEVYRYLIDRETTTEALSAFLESSFKDR